MTVLYTALAIALALASIAAHEWGHLDAMRRLGVDVERFSLGFGPALWSRTLASGLKIQLGALPLGGFVMPRDAAQVDRLSARDNARFSGAGVWVNCALGLVLMGFGGLVGTGYQILLCLILVAVGIAVWLLRRLLGPFHLLLGVIGIALIAYAVLHPLSGPGPSVFAGPIELYKLLVVSNLSDALNDAGAVSLTIGLINSLPLPPLDGGRVVARFLRDRAGERAYRISMLVGVLLVLASMAVTLVHDIAVDVFGLHFL